MKKNINDPLATISLDIIPLSRDVEGKFLGGYSGMQGNSLSLEFNDVHCGNYSCNNKFCYNNFCENNNCMNTPCYNDRCFNEITETQTVTQTNSQSAKPLFSNFEEIFII